MKSFLRLAYWPVIIIPILLILGSLGYNIFDAFIISLTFLPSSIILRLLLPKVPGKGTRQRKLAMFSIISGTFAIQLLLVLVTHYLIGNYDSVYREYHPLPIMTNPFFLVLLLGATAMGNFIWNNYLNRNFRSAPESVTFISDRHSVTLLKSDISYVESRDSEVWIHAADGRKFRNKTPISQWENLLGEGFIRVHRAFLVAADSITGHTDVTVIVGQEELPVSRKYKDNVTSKDTLTK